MLLKCTKPMSKPHLYIITGQTASGKTQLAQEYAEKLNGELVNCDSRQIYKYLDIVTGKDITNQKFHAVKKLNNFSIGYYLLQQSKIWLYDIVDPQVHFSSYDYQTCALDVISDILKRGKTPIIVGGTYFYLKHLLYEIPSESIPPDWKKRQALESKTVQELQNTLFGLNKTLMNKLNESDRQNKRRLIRKIEITLNTNSAYRNSLKTTLPKLNRLLKIPDLKINFLGLQILSKEELVQRISQRVRDRIDKGAMAEVEKLTAMGYQDNAPGLQTIGCRQIRQFQQGLINKKQLMEQWITKETQYAKRQLTFMKKDPAICWRLITCK